MPSLDDLQDLIAQQDKAAVHDWFNNLKKNNVKNGLIISPPTPPVPKAPPVKAKTTDEYVDEYLDNNPIDTGLDPCLFAEHLREASALLDGCLARRDHIRELECDTVLTSLDYLLADQLEEGDLALAKVALKAARAQGNAAPTDANDETLTHQFTLREQARLARQVLHTEDGHPLNYNQRVKELRALFADDIRSIRERLTSARIGAHHAGVARDLPKIPEWSRTSADNLRELVLWCRDAIRKTEIGSRNETVYRKVFSLKASGMMAMPNFNSLVAGGYYIDVKDEHFFVKGPHRVLDVAMAYAGQPLVSSDASYSMDPGVRAAQKTQQHMESERARRDAMQRVFGGMLALPEQSAQLSGSGKVTWTKQKLQMRDEIFPWQGLDALRMPVAGSGKQVLNANPIGKWVFTPDANYRTELGGVAKVSDLRDWAIKEIVLVMTVASAQSA